MSDKIRVSKWGIPLIYYLDVNEKIYEVKNIIIYNKDGNVYVNSRGYFESNNEVISGFTITQPKLKRKINFSNNENFIVSRGKGKFDRYPKCDLYIHESEAKFEPLKQHVFRSETNTDTIYEDINMLQIGDLTFNVSTNIVFEKKTIKIEAERLENEFHELNIYGIDDYDIVKILKHYNITRKE